MEKPVKVLQVLDFINYNSGVSAVVMNYYFHMSEEKVQCDFLLFGQTEKEWQDKLAARGSKIYTTGQPGGRNIREYRKNVDEFFAQHGKEYDVVHVHIPNAAFAVLRSAEKYGVSVRILHSHNARGADGLVKKARNFVLNKWGIRYANQYFACSVAAGKYLYGDKKMESGQVAILNNAVDLTRYRYDPKIRGRIRGQLGLSPEISEEVCGQPGRSPEISEEVCGQPGRSPEISEEVCGQPGIGGEILLGHVGRFVEQKNHMQLLEIFFCLRKAGLDCKLLLLGDGPLRESVQKRAEELCVREHIIFAGVVSNVQEYMSAMDMFLLPSLYEGLPVVCVEAQAAGLPCLVSTNVTREIGLSENVFFLENEDAAGWCRTVGELAGRQNDRTRITGMDGYDIEKQAKRLEESYRSYGKSPDTDVHL